MKLKAELTLAFLAPSRSRFLGPCSSTPPALLLLSSSSSSSSAPPLSRTFKASFSHFSTARVSNPSRQQARTNSDVGAPFPRFSSSSSTTTTTNINNAKIAKIANTSMKATQVTSWGEIPKFVEVPAPAPPPADSDRVQVRVLATGLHTLVRIRAAGKHYSARGLPHLPGVDGVGRTVPDDRLVYFKHIEAQGGSFAELIEVPRAEVFPLPAGADPVQVAGLLNPVMASWMAIARRSYPRPEPGWTCVVMGATSVSGQAAVAVARHFGAAKVVGIARAGSAARQAALGYDAAVELAAGDPAETEFGDAALDADVILDFLYGPPMLAYFKALRPRKPVRYVQIGTSVEPDIPFPGDLLRSKDITLRGTGPGAFDKDTIAEELPHMLGAIAGGMIKPYPFKVAKLEEIEQAWQATGQRTVFVP